MNAQVEVKWIPVCETSDLLANVGICVKIQDRQVAIFKIQSNDTSSLYAIDNHDPFSQANVLSRGIVGDLKGHDVIASPIYKQHFDLKTGQCQEDDGVTIPIYKVRENEGKIEVLFGNEVTG